MRLYIPVWLDDWLNRDVYRRVRRIDIFLVLAGIGCVAWYGHSYGIRGAVAGFVAYVAMLWVGLFMRSQSE